MDFSDNESDGTSSDCGDMEMLESSCATLCDSNFDIDWPDDVPVPLSQPLHAEVVSTPRSMVSTSLQQPLPATRYVALNAIATVASPAQQPSLSTATTVTNTTVVPISPASCASIEGFEAIPRAQDLDDEWVDVATCDAAPQWATDL